MIKLPKFFTLLKRTQNDAGWFCLSIGRQGAHFVRMKRTGTQIQVLMCMFFPMPQVSSAALEKIVREHRLESYQCTTLLAPDEYQILMVDAPKVQADELKMAVRYSIKNSLSYPVENAMVDVLQIPGNKNTQSHPKSLYAIAASNDTLQKRVDLFEKAGINLSVIDIPEMALRNIATLYETPGRGLAMLVFDESGGLLNFTCDGELYLSRRLEITSGQLQDENENHRQQYFDRVELEVQRSLDYFDRQFNQISMKRMLVHVPGGVHIVKQLTDSLGLPVEALDLTQVMDVGDVPDLLDSEFLTEALLPLGAALRQERRAI
jgi:MSHA biogenesis protein MshI